MFQTLPLTEGARGEAMTPPRKRTDRATLPRPKLTAIPDELVDYIASYVWLVRDLVWEDFVKKRRLWGDVFDLEGV